VDEAEERLRSLLLDAGLDLALLEPRGTWEVFKRFAAESVEGVAGSDADLCLFEYGVYDWSDGKGSRFNWSLCRQFTIYEGGDYDHMEQLRCDLYFTPTPELEAVGGADCWSGLDLAEWVREVEALPGFRAVLDAQPVESVFGQEEV